MVSPAGLKASNAYASGGAACLHAESSSWVPSQRRVGLGATPALARDERLLADILYGVSDALVRDYIRDRYEDGRWDGHYWYYGGHRYTPHEYGRYWAEEYHRQPPKKPKKRKKPHPHPRDWDDDDDDDDDRRRPHHRPPPPPPPHWG